MPPSNAYGWIKRERERKGRGKEEEEDSRFVNIHYVRAEKGEGEGYTKDKERDIGGMREIRKNLQFCTVECGEGRKERDVAEEGGEKKEFFSPEPMYPFD